MGTVNEAPSLEVTNEIMTEIMTLIYKKCEEHCADTDKPNFAIYLLINLLGNVTERLSTCPEMFVKNAALVMARLEEWYEFALNQKEMH
jgi:hypothetical protein